MKSILAENKKIIPLNVELFLKLSFLNVLAILFCLLAGLYFFSFSSEWLHWLISCSVIIAILLIVGFWVYNRLIDQLFTPVRKLTKYINYLRRNNLEHVVFPDLQNSSPDIGKLANEIQLLHQLVIEHEVQRNKAEKNLRYNEIKYREISDLLPQSIFETDAQGDITYVNKHWYKVFGYAKQKIDNGLNINEIIVDLSISKINSATVTKECSAIHSDGTSFPVVTYTTNIVKNNKHLGIRGIIIDDTERKQHIQEIENALKKAEESDNLKSTFLANMSHEIRTPMNAIIGFSNLLEDDDLSQSVRHEYLGYIKSSGNHLLKLIDDIIDLARIEAGKLNVNYGPCNINELCNELYAMFANLKKQQNKGFELDVHKEFDNTDIFIETDKARLMQILINLLNNSFKFTNAGIIEFGYSIYSDIIQFYVKDTGTGIPSSMMDTIFDRFMQLDNTRYGGNGLGLNITKNLVQLLGGNIWVHSIESKGATFFFTIPFKLINNTDMKINNLQMPALPRGLKVLVAEDNDLNYFLLERIFSHTGVKISRARNGKEAVNMSKKNFDLVLMDIQMPVLDGISATKEIKQFKPNLPIIAQTAFAFDKDKAQCIEAGCDGYVSKPIQKEKLFRIINCFVSARESSLVYNN